MGDAQQLWYCGTKIMLTSTRRESRVQTMKRLQGKKTEFEQAGLPHQPLAGTQLDAWSQTGAMLEVRKPHGCPKNRWCAVA